MTMRCEAVDALLLEFVDGGLPAGRAAAVRGHLAGCPRCAGAEEDLRATLALVHLDVVPEPPPGTWERFADDVRARVRTAETAAAPRARPGPVGSGAWAWLSDWVFSPPALAAAVAVLLLIGMFRNPPSPFVPERHLALVRDLEVLRAVDRPEDLDVIQELPALLAAIGQVS